MQQQVRRLDIAVGKAGVPQPSHDAQRVIDYGVIDLGIAKLYRAIEELTHHQVLPFGREHDDAVRRGCRQPGIAHQAQ